MRVCKKDHIEAYMRIYMKVSMNIKSTVRLFWNFSIKVCSEVHIKLHNRSCQKAVFKAYVCGLH